MDANGDRNVDYSLLDMDPVSGVFHVSLLADLIEDEMKKCGISSQTDYLESIKWRCRLEERV